MNRRSALTFSAALLATALAATPIRAADLIFTSGALAPITEAQKLRTIILKDYKGKVTFLPDEPPAMLTLFHVAVIVWPI